MGTLRIKQTPIFVKKHFLKIDCHNPILDLIQNDEYKAMIEEELNKFKNCYNVLAIRKTSEKIDKFRVLYPFFWISYVYREEWVYISTYSAMLLELIARFNEKFPTLYWWLIYTIINIIKWWTTDYFYSTWEEWKKLLESIKKWEISDELYELFQKLTCDLTKIWKLAENELFAIKNQIVWIERINMNLSEEEKKPIMNPYKKPYYYVVNKPYLEDYKNHYWNVWNEQMFSEIVVKRECFVSDEFIYVILSVLCYDINLYLYYCPYTQDVRISDVKSLNFAWDDVYLIMNFTEFVRWVLKLDNQLLDRRNYIDTQLNPNEVREMISEAMENFLSLKPDSFSYHMECIVDDKNRFQEINSLVKHWTVWYVKDNREKQKISVTQEDDYETYVKRKKRKNKKRDD